MLLDCLHLAIRDVSVLRRVDMHEAVYRAEEVLTEWAIEEETGLSQNPVLGPNEFSVLVKEVADQVSFGAQFHPE
jgi:hypothetical protein